MNNAEEVKEKIDKILCKLEMLVDDVSQLDESSRVERTKDMLNRAVDELCMLYSEWEE